jgi:hypothetical protein
LLARRQRLRVTRTRALVEALDGECDLTVFFPEAPLGRCEPVGGGVFRTVLQLAVGKFMNLRRQALPQSAEPEPGLPSTVRNA